MPRVRRTKKNSPETVRGHQNGLELFERSVRPVYGPDRRSTGAWIEKSAPDEMLYLATLINPVDHRLYVALWHDSHLWIATPTNGTELDVWAKGYLSAEDDPAGKTDCPRSHTPTGAAVRGHGFGLMLYAGLALAAAYASTLNRRVANEWGLPRGMQACISSSTDQRSGAATKWWEAQVERGFATETEIEGECESRDVRDEIDVGNVSDIDEDYIQGLIDEEGDISDIEGTLSGRINFTFCPRGSQAQMLEATRVFDKNLVFHWNPKLDGVVAESDAAETLPKTILLELDVADLGEPHLLELIVNELRESDATETEMRDFFRKNRIADQPPLKGIELGESRPFYRYKRNPKHGRAWKSFFGELTLEL